MKTINLLQTKTLVILLFVLFFSLGNLKVSLKAELSEICKDFKNETKVNYECADWLYE